MSIALDLAPVILLDSLEPLPFTDVAVTVLTPGDRSPSNGSVLAGPGDIVVEYALWVDMEIGHAYELEHVWVFADHLGNPLAVRGSAHGATTTLTTPLKGERTVVYSEPGKHGTAASPEDYAISRQLVNTLCDTAAGTMGVLRPLIGNDLGCSVSEYRQAWNILRGLRFAPAWDAGLILDTRDLHWSTWEELDVQRAHRALAAISLGSKQPVGVPVGDWGGQEDAWIGRITRGTEGLYLGDIPLVEAFTEAQLKTRLVVAVTEDVSMTTAVTKAAWNCYASAHTFIVCPFPSVVTRAASLIVPAKYVTGTAQIAVSKVPREDLLTLGPGGDLDCPLELLDRNGFVS